MLSGDDVPARHSRPCLGHICFRNVLPVSWRLRHDAPDDFRFITGVPAEMNRAILEGRSSISNVSSILYAKHPDELVPLPGLCVTAPSAVTSILLVARKPISEWRDGEPIALTAQSETSHALAKILLTKYDHLHPRYRVAPLSVTSDADMLPEDATAALHIGDNALWIYHHKQPDLFYYDLGTLWKERTGLPMVYALWVARREFAASHPDALKEMARWLKRALTPTPDERKAMIEEQAREKVHGLSFTEPELTTYLTDVIHWELGALQLRGLKAFYEGAVEIGLIREMPPLQSAAL